MELAFQKIDGQWVAEFEATSDFNINLDRVSKGALVIYQKGSKDGTYASQASYRNIKDSENVDADITALVYPKYIKVVSQTEVVKGIVTMEGKSGSSGSGGGLRPVTAEDFSSISLYNSETGSMDAIFSDTITVNEQTSITIRLNNKKADLVQPIKEECQLLYNKDQDQYGYHNKNYAPTTFNMSQLYIKEN